MPVAMQNLKIKYLFVTYIKIQKYVLRTRSYKVYNLNITWCNLVLQDSHVYVRVNAISPPLACTCSHWLSIVFS
jgi:hypothetical protein